MKRWIVVLALIFVVPVLAGAQTSSSEWIEQCPVAIPVIERVIVERNIDLGQLPDVQQVLAEAKAACAAGDDVKAAAHIDYISRQLFAQ
jgi:hypothetical protein